MKIILPLFSMLMFYSCCLLDWEPQPFVRACDSCCYEIDLSGRLINGATKDGVSDKFISFYWNTYVFPKTIAQAKSDSTGYFQFNMEIDTCQFEHNNLVIYLPESSEFVVFTESNKFTFDATPFEKNDSLNFELFPRTILQVIFMRVETDSLKHFSASLSYKPNDIRGIRTINFDDFGQPSADLIATVPMVTSAQIPTYIYWEKTTNKGIFQFSDSITCSMNTANSYVLSY